MLTVIQTPAAGTDFDGLTGGVTGTGLIDFSELDELEEGPNIVPIITGISLDNNGNADTMLVNCFLKPAADALTTTRRKTIRRPALEISQFNIDGCKIYVPREVATFPLILTPWTLILITTGKTALASWVVSMTTGPIPGGGGF